MRITLAAGLTDVDTGVIQQSKSFPAGEPTLGVSAAAPGPADGALPVSRINVLPMAPTAAWANVTHGEPYLNTTTGTIHVEFNNAGEVAVTINVLVWNPSTLASPGQADTYHTGG
jgi:hypothetical protein